MSNVVQKANIIQFTPFLNYIEGLLNEKFYSVSESKVVKILEIGCGPGDFSLLLKEKLGSKVVYTAMDAGDDIAKAMAKSNGSDVNFIKGDIFEHQFDSKYDVVLFTKSLHHCNPVEKAVKIAYDLLEQDGIFFAEEFDPTHLTQADKYWYFERYDLLRAADCFIPIDERLKNSKHMKDMLTKFLDTSLPIDERFVMGKHRHHGHGEHTHGEHTHGEHNHGEHTHGKHTHSHQHVHSEGSEKLHRDDPAGIAPYNEIISVIETQFGKDTVKTMPAPFFYNFLVLSGLKDTEGALGALQEYLKQEQLAIAENRVHPLGLNILVTKN